MEDLFDKINEVDMRKALKIAAATATIGSVAMLGGKGMHNNILPKHVPSAVKTAKNIPREPGVQSSQLNKSVPSKPLGTSSIDINKIWQIESSKGTDPKMADNPSGARGHFQFLENTWNEVVGKMGKDWDWRTGSMDYEKSSQVADFYLNTEIPRLLKHFGIEDSFESRLVAYNLGIGNLKNLVDKHGNEWLPMVPRESLNYIRKYNKRVKESTGIPVIISHNSYGDLKLMSNDTKKIYKYSNVNDYLYKKILKTLKRKPHKVWQMVSSLEDKDSQVSKEEVVESTIDFPRPTLDTQVWQKVGEGYELKGSVKQHILAVLDRYPGENLSAIAKTIRIVGSICTNLYTESVDIDVHIEPKDKEAYTIEDQVKIMRWFNDNRDAINGWIGEHPIEVYLQLDPNQDLLSDGCYDMTNDVWQKGPRILPTDYDPYENFKNIADEITDQTSQVDLLLGELKRDAIDHDVILNALNKLPLKYKKDLLTKLTNKLKEIEDGIEKLYSKRKEWTEIRRNASKPATPEQAREDAELVSKWQDANATFKFINRYQYMRVIKDLADLLEDGEISSDDVDDVKGIVGVV